MDGGMLLKGAGLIMPYALTVVGVFRHIMKRIVFAPTAGRRWTEVTAMRLIDGDKLQEFPIRANRCDKEHANTHFINGIESVMEYAELLPTVDAVPVVRCKECKWFADNNDGEWFGCWLFQTIRIIPEDAPKPDDFCSYGERKEGAEC
nr:MAG TPA: hypothetical protein [Caudoviricetes sp.]